MSIVSDALDSIKAWFKDTLANGIVSSLQLTCDTLNNTFSSSNQGIMKNLLNSTPDKFTGSTAKGATPIWSSIEKITNNAIVPVAIFILVVVIVYELIQMVVSNNNFRDFDTSIFFRWSIKAVCGILLVSNVFYITTNIFGFGVTAVTSGLNTLFPKGKDFLEKATLNTKLSTNLANHFNEGQLFVMLLLSAAVLLVTFLVLGSIIVVLSSRMIEIFMYLSISPIPMATMMNNDWGQIGKNWLRNILALAFQGFFIVVALMIFKTMLGNVIVQFGKESASSAENLMGSLAVLLGYVIALIFTIFRSSNISKSAFGAQ